MVHWGKFLIFFKQPSRILWRKFKNSGIAYTSGNNVSEEDVLIQNFNIKDTVQNNKTLNKSQTIQDATCTVLSVGMGKKVEKTEALYQPVFYLMKCIKPVSFPTLYVDQGVADNLGSPCFSSCTRGCADTHVQSLVKGTSHCSLRIMRQWLPYV